ncbi:MAG: exodeoxyribonuclease VII small subunit [Planctomycetes bacterium]|jgi:exodeoxyribonuclease VII small subunit|nr:exodeoxyribonuclease VII small subunit [Planctomycetota bacterium]
MVKSEEKIGDKLKKLNSIVAWFESQEQADVEEGLKKVKEGAALIKELKEKLKQVENEFIEIKKDLDA